MLWKSYIWNVVKRLHNMADETRHDFLPSRLFFFKSGFWSNYRSNNNDHTKKNGEPIGRAENRRYKRLTTLAHTRIQHSVVRAFSSSFFLSIRYRHYSWHALDDDHSDLIEYWHFRRRLGRLERPQPFCWWGEIGITSVSFVLFIKAPIKEVKSFVRIPLASFEN